LRTTWRKFVNATKKLPKEYTIDRKYQDYFISISKNKKRIYFVKTDEIETNKGHISIIGFKGKIKKRKLREVLKQAKKQRCVVIANHPLHEYGLSYFLFWGENISLSKKTIRKNKKFFDAVELNAYFPENWKKVRIFSKKNKIPVVADSDAHSFNEFFKSYFELENINFNNPKKFKKSLKKALKKKIKIHAREHGFEAKYKHIAGVFLEEIGEKLGVIKV